MRRSFEMCVVNVELVAELSTIAKTNADLAARLGISWNSWIKVVAGIPIRKSLAHRLRERVLSHAAQVDGFRRRFPCGQSPDGVDRAALSQAFLRPASGMVPVPALRSVRSARAFAQAHQQAAHR